MTVHDSHSMNGHGHNGQHELSFLRKYIFSTDHKVIGVQFLFSTLIFMLIGGTLAAAIRWQRAYPDSAFPLIGQWLWPSNAGKMPDHIYTMVVSMHASVMIFFVIIPILAGAFGNFLIPLQVGYKDMAFPTLNMLSYWFMWPAFIMILCSFFAEGGGAQAGWTSYPPLSVVRSAAPGSANGQTLWFMAVIFVGVSSMMGSLNYITTIINCRAPGMKLFRMPMTTWAMFITALLQVFALPVLTVALFMGLLDNLEMTAFFVPRDADGLWTVNSDVRTATGGQPLMWQHLFWFYSHPAVYIMILPAMGMVSDIISTFARKPLFGYRAMVYSIAGIAGLGFIVWGHHMFMSGMAPKLGMAFMVSTMMIALPSAVKVFNWIGTAWGGNIQFTTPMLFALGFVAMFIIGGLSGVFLAATPVDIHFHDNEFVVAHIHYVLVSGSLFGIFGGIYFWFPKMFGRMMNETWGKVHFALTFLAYNGFAYPMHILGVIGTPRRYSDARPQIDPAMISSVEFLNKFITHSAYLLMATQVIFIVNFLYSLFKGPKATTNPWNSNSLEWQAPSPPPHGNFAEVPVVHRGPYEYSHPLVLEDYLPQTHAPVEGEHHPAGAH